MATAVVCRGITGILLLRQVRVKPLLSSRVSLGWREALTRFRLSPRYFSMETPTSPITDAQRMETPAIPVADAQQMETPAIPVTDAQRMETPTIPVADAQRMETPAIPVTDAQQMETPAIPVADAQQMETPTIPITDAQRMETPTIPVADAQQMETPTIPVADAQRMETPAIPVTDAQQMETLAIPVADAQQMETPTIPITDAQRMETPTIPVADAQQMETPTSPITDAQRMETPTIPVADAQQMETPTIPVADAQRMETPAIPVTDAQRMETPAIPVADAQRMETPASEEGVVVKSHDSGEESHDEETMSCDVAGGDPYSYLQKGFSSEIYKIEISNVSPHVGYKQLRKFLQNLGLKPVKIKKPQKTCCFVTFQSEEDREAALQTVNGLTWKNRSLSAKVAAPLLDPHYKRKRKASPDGSDTESDAKRPRPLELSIEERLENAVTPLLSKPYQEQLEMKHALTEKFLRRAATAVQKKDSDPGEWFVRHIEQHNGMICSLEAIRPSPLQSGYRNKCEFSIGTMVDGKPVVGFRLASYEEGDLTVAPPDSCIHIPQPMKDMVKSFQQYFCHSSLSPYSHITGSGHWRQVSIRCQRTGESMALVQLHPQQLTQDNLAAEKREMVEWFTTGEGLKCSPSSLYIQSFGRNLTGTEKPVYDHLLGEKHVHEVLLDMKFRISPEAFFQVNTHATEVLYSLVKELCSGTGSPSVVYDICCGTGTIGLFLTKSLPLKRLVGVEMVEQAIEDAKENAKLNGITNAEFVCGKAEDVLPKQLEAHFGARAAIGVVDPPRGGLHPRVVQVIRKCSAIQRLVYVSCNPEGALSNFVDLCRRESNRIRGTPFCPVKAIPVDLFPHTKHYELVVLFERVHTKDLHR